MNSINLTRAKHTGIQTVLETEHDLVWKEIEQLRNAKPQLDEPVLVTTSIFRPLRGLGPVPGSRLEASVVDNLLSTCQA